MFVGDSFKEVSKAGLGADGLVVVRTRAFIKCSENLAVL